MEPDGEETGMPGIISTYKFPIVLGAGSVFVIILSIVLFFKSAQSAAPIQFSDDKNASASAELGTTTIKVDVEGAVIHPGLYSVPEGSRVEDAITAAGGLASDVDGAAFARSINRAMKLVDGGKLYIPVKSDGSADSSTGLDTLSNVGNLVSINTGTESQLDSLAGVGPVTAQKIIANRPYQTLEEIVSKKAVGAALFEKIKSKLSL